MQQLKVSLVGWLNEYLSCYLWMVCEALAAMQGHRSHFPAQCSAGAPQLASQLCQRGGGGRGGKARQRVGFPRAGNRQMDHDLPLAGNLDNPTNGAYQRSDGAITWQGI